MTDEVPSFDSFAAFKAAQTAYYRSLCDEPGYQGACARLALAIRFQLFEWLDGEMRRHTRPDKVLDAMSTMLATCAGEITQSIRHTCERQAGQPAPPIEYWTTMVLSSFEEEFREVCEKNPGHVIEVKGGKPLREA